MFPPPRFNRIRRASLQVYNALSASGPIVLKNAGPASQWLPSLQLPDGLGPLQRCGCVVYHICSNPDSLAGAAWFLLCALSILLSSATYIAESLPEYRVPYKSAPAAFDAVDTACLICFVIDYAARFCTCAAIPWNDENPVGTPTSGPSDTSIAGQVYHRGIRKLVRFVIKPLNIVDAVSIFPSIAALVNPSDQDDRLLILRIIRLVRFVRIIHVYEDSFLLTVIRAVYSSLEALAILLLLLALIVIFLSSAIFFCESGTWDDSVRDFVRPNALGTGVEITPFRSIPHAMWYSLASMVRPLPCWQGAWSYFVFSLTHLSQTTVGYGDIVPATSCGKAVGSVVILCGVMVLALPITVLGGAFSREVEAHSVRRQAARAAAAAADASRAAQNELSAGVGVAQAGATDAPRGNADDDSADKAESTSRARDECTPETFSGPGGSALLSDGDGVALQVADSTPRRVLAAPAVATSAAEPGSECGSVEGVRLLLVALARRLEEDSLVRDREARELREEIRRLSEQVAVLSGAVQ